MHNAQFRFSFCRCIHETTKSVRERQRPSEAVRARPCPRGPQVRTVRGPHFQGPGPHGREGPPDLQDSPVIIHDHRTQEIVLFSGDRLIISHVA